MSGKCAAYVRIHVKLKTVSKSIIEINRVGEPYHFVAQNSDKIEVNIDASVAVGGTNSGVRPMELLLMGLGGCAAIDVISILKKARQPVEDLKITVTGERDDHAVPAPYTAIHIHYIFKGDLKSDKIEYAIKLSEEKYCSASVMLEKTAEITHSFEIIKP